MTDDPRRRALMRQGFLFLFLALVLGLAIIALPHPSRWLAAHLTAFLTGLMLVVIALAWSELRLTDGQRMLAYATGLVAAYGGLVGNVFGAIIDLPGPASNPGVVPPMRKRACSWRSSRSSFPVSLFLSAWCCTGCEALRQNGEVRQGTR
jgi:hypothetical protein